MFAQLFKVKIVQCPTNHRSADRWQQFQIHD